MMVELEKKAKKEKKVLFTGRVVSDKMDKTIIVEAERTFKHPRFHKIVKKTKRYKVHDEQEQAKTGDLVTFVEGSPCSKSKYMYLEEVVKTGSFEPAD